MTTIAYRGGILAADSLETLCTEAGGARKFHCEKIYRKKLPDGSTAIIACAGESSPALLFLDWYGTKKKPLKVLIDAVADFTCLVLTKAGLFEYDAYCRPLPVMLEPYPFYAIGSGAKAALGAMHAGADAATAVEIACRVDTYSAPPVVTMRLDDAQ